MATNEYFYSRGRKVPVSRREDLVALRIDPAAEPARLEAAVSRARDVAGAALQPSDEFAEMQSETLRIFKAPQSGERQAREAAAEAATIAPGVKVGEVYTNDSGRPLVLTDEIVVKFRRDLGASDVQSLRAEYGLDEVEKIAFSENAYLLRTADGDTTRALEVANALVERGLADYAHPSWIEYIGFRALMPAEAPAEAPFAGRAIPTDPMFPQQWHLRNTGQNGGTPGADIRATAAWDVTMGNPAIRVAVIDGGTDIAHADLSAPGKSVDPINLMVTPPTSNPAGGSHGTQVAGMAVASANNGVVGCGSAPNCRLIAIRAHDTTTQLNMAKGFVYAADRGADVVTCSLGPNSGAWTMQDELEEAVAYATTFGRGGRGTVYFHAVANGTQAVSLDEVCSNERAIAVGRSDNRDRYDGASFGPELDLIAPGVDVTTITNTTTGNTATSTTTTGTSFAAPLSAGVAALVLSVNPNLSWEQVRQVLFDSADKIDTGTMAYSAAPAGQPPGTRNDNCGYGRVNAQQAVAIASAPQTRDLYIRDTNADSGTVPQPAWGFWDSPDIWVRNADDGGTAHQAPIDGQSNFVFARIRNRGTQTSHPAWVRFLVAAFAGTEFRYPFDYKRDTTGSPGGTPGNLKDASAFPATGTYLIGTQRIGPIPAGGSVVVKQQWPDSLVTASGGFHSCLLVDITPHDGPVPAGEHVWENNNLGQKNVTVLPAVRGKLVEFRFQWGNEASKETFAQLEVRRIKGPRLATYLDLKSTALLPGVANLHNIKLPKFEFGEAVPGPIDLGPEILPILPQPFEGGKPNFTLTFLDAAKVAIQAPGTRDDDSSFVVTFPRGSSVELNRGDVAAPDAGEGIEDDERALLANSISFAKIGGQVLLKLNEKLQSALVRIPVQKPARREAALRVEVPENAAKGDVYVIDVGAKNSRGQLVGGVRLQIEVVG